MRALHPPRLIEAMGASAPIVRGDLYAFAAARPRICNRLFKQSLASPGASASGINHQLADLGHRTLVMQLPFNANIDEARDLAVINKNKAAKRRTLKLPCKTRVKGLVVKAGVLKLAQQLINSRAVANDSRSNHHGNIPLHERTLSIE